MAPFNQPDALNAFSLCPGIFVLGCLESGVTVYSQQVRALNLAWALERALDIRRLAIVGGGIAGLTLAAAALAKYPNAEVSVFERRADLIPLQQASDSRWLHPRIYDWPDYDSMRPSADLPVLNWTEGRASDIAHNLLLAFAKFTMGSVARLRVAVGVEYLKIDHQDRILQWIGNTTDVAPPFFRPAGSMGREEQFDAIVLATGFGLERQHKDARFLTPSYWRNDALAQPALETRNSKYVVSGAGDGGLIDLCRVRIERFRQDRIVAELFSDIPEGDLRAWKAECKTENALAVFSQYDAQLAAASNRLRSRMRKDTVALLHFEKRAANSLAVAFAGKASFLNKLLLFLLYRAGGFLPVVGELEDVVVSHGVGPGRVVCRHGANAHGHLLGLFQEQDAVEALLKPFTPGRQPAKQMWPLGFFPYKQEW